MFQILHSHSTSRLHLAVDKGNASIVDILLAQGLGSRIDTKDLEGKLYRNDDAMEK